MMIEMNEVLTSLSVAIQAAIADEKLHVEQRLMAQLDVERAKVAAAIDQLLSNRTARARAEVAALEQGVMLTESATREAVAARHALIHERWARELSVCVRTVLRALGVDGPLPPATIEIERDNLRGTLQYVRELLATVASPEYVARPLENLAAHVVERTRRCPRL